MKNNILLVYAYFEKPSANYNLSFFVNRLRDNIDYIFVINGYECKVKIPCLPNVTVIRRENTGFDYWAYRIGIDHVSHKIYDYYFFVNSGVLGPILPWHSEEMDWTKVFTSKINDKVKMVGTTVLCCNSHPTHSSRNLPLVEGFFFVTDHTGLSVLLTDSFVFTKHANKEDSARHGEYAVTECLFKHGYTIDCILRRYQGVDWTDRNQWRNHGIPITRPNCYYGTSINPYEVIFHKWMWPAQNQLVNPKIVYDYVEDCSK